MIYYLALFAATYRRSVTFSQVNAKQSFQEADHQADTRPFKGLGVRRLG